MKITTIKDVAELVAPEILHLHASDREGYAAKYYIRDITAVSDNRHCLKRVQRFCRKQSNRN